MASAEYLSGRKQWSRPQAMIWSDVPFLLENGGYVPSRDAEEGIDFIIVTDHSRGPISMSKERIESRSRMINGTSRSHHTADKLSLSTEWTLLPSRIAETPAVFDPVTGAQIAGGEAYVADKASAATDLNQWYDTHVGPFWVYLSYDLGAGTDTMTKYSDARFMFFESYSTTLSKRGIYDMWDISVTLGEV